MVQNYVDEVPIAEVFKHNCYSEEADKGNVRLIAAAPDMEDMLNEVKGTLLVAAAYIQDFAALKVVRDQINRINELFKRMEEAKTDD